MLILEAFAYTNKLMHEQATADEEMELEAMSKSKKGAFSIRDRGIPSDNVDSRHPSSAPARSTAASAYAEDCPAKKTSRSKLGPNGLVKKLRSLNFHLLP